MTAKKRINLNGKEVRDRMEAMACKSLVCSYHGGLWQFVAYFDSLAIPWVEGAPMDRIDDAVEDCLTRAEREKGYGKP